MTNYWWIPTEDAKPIRLRISKTTPLTDVETWKGIRLPKRTELDGVTVNNGCAQVEYEGRKYVVTICYCTIVTGEPKRTSPLTAEQEKLVLQYARRAGSYIEEVTSWSGDSWTLRIVCHFSENIRTYHGGYTSQRTQSDMVFSIKKGDAKARARFEAKRDETARLLAEAR